MKVSLIWQNCVVCGKSVDVDNCFGTIGEGETFCDEHDSIRKALDKIKQIKDEIWTLNYHMEQQYDQIYNLLAKERTVMKYKAQHDKVLNIKDRMEGS